MLKFILNIIIMLSFGTILYLVARTLPRIDDRDIGVPSLKNQWFVVYLEKFDKKLKYYWEKTLRRAGIIVLKLDNMINKKLSNLKKESEKETGFITEAESDKSKKESVSAAEEGK